MPTRRLADPVPLDLKETRASTLLLESRFDPGAGAARPAPGRAVVVRVAIEELRALMAAACHAAGVPERETAVVVDHFLAGELRGKSSHGVAKFCFESRLFRERQAPPEVVRERGVFAVIDAHREIGPLSATFAVTVALDKAARHGAGFVGVINTQRYGILAAWSEEIARHGLVGIAANTSRAEAAVAGGRTPVLGVTAGAGSAGSAEDCLFRCLGEYGLGGAGDSDPVPVEDHVEGAHGADPSGELAAVPQGSELPARLRERGEPVAGDVVRADVAEKKSPEVVGEGGPHPGVGQFAAQGGALLRDGCRRGTARARCRCRRGRRRRGPRARRCRRSSQRLG